MTTHSTTLAWRVPWTEQPGGLHTVHGVAKGVRPDLATEEQPQSASFLPSLCLLPSSSSLLPQSLPPFLPPPPQGTTHIWQD